MPFKCLRESAADAGALFGQALLGLFCWAAVTGGSAAAESAVCALTAPRYQSQGGKVSFETTLDCAATDATRPIPLGADLLVGLTVYAASDAKDEPFDQQSSWIGRTLLAAPDIAAALGEGTQSQQARVAEEPKWIVLTDGDHDSFDFPAKTLRIARKGEQVTVKFQGNEKDLAGKDHFLFAVWPASARSACDKADKYSRPGCRRYGYVLGDGAGVEPLAAYPGLEINNFGHPSGADWTSERWIVERFR